MKKTVLLLAILLLGSTAFSYPANAQTQVYFYITSQSGNDIVNINCDQMGATGSATGVGWQFYTSQYPNTTTPTAGGSASICQTATTALPYGQINSGTDINTQNNLWINIQFPNGGGFNYYANIRQNGNYTNIGTSTATFIEPYSPANGTLNATTSEIFSFQYNNACSDPNLDSVSIDITDVTNPNQTLIPFPQNLINGCGTFTYSAGHNLFLGDTYLWRPKIFSSGGTSTPIYGNWYSLVASSSAEITLNPNSFSNATLGSSTLPSATNFLSFLNVPQLLTTKVPFGYFFQAKNQITEAINGTSSANVPIGNIQFNLGFGTSTIELFGTTTLGKYLNQTDTTLLRSTMLIVLLAEFAYALYHRARSAHLI